MLYIDGCPACNHFKDLIFKYKIENRFIFVNANTLKISEDILLMKDNKKMSFPTFFVMDENGEKKIISRILLKEFILKIVGDNST